MAKLKKTENSKPLWLKYTDKEIKDIILSLADKGLTSEKIGLVLRDQYGVPKTKLYGFKISTILKEKGIFQEPTAINLQKKADNLSDHHKKNKQDRTAERSLGITKAKLKKANDYLNRKNIQI